MLAFKDELVYDLIGSHCSKSSRKSGGCKRFKQESKYKFDSNRLLNVGDHLPGKGVGTDHLQGEKETMDQSLHRKRHARMSVHSRNPNQHSCAHNLFVCIKPEGTCFQVFTKKYSFGYDTFIQSGFKTVHRKTRICKCE